MKRIFGLLLVMLSFCGAVQAQSNESCGPKSGLCWPVVKRGASGPRVKALQFLLRAKGFNVAPDGRFGFSTERALRKFQAQKRLQVDGKLGWQSWEALTPNLKRGAKGDAVRALQTLLIFQKHKVARDGVFGSATQKAILNGPFYFEPVGNDYSDGRLRDEEWCYLTGGQFQPRVRDTD